MPLLARHSTDSDLIFKSNSWQSKEFKKKKKYDVSSMIANMNSRMENIGGMIIKKP